MLSYLPNCAGLQDCINWVWSVCSGEDIEKEACFILGLLAIKQDHQHAIADRGALPGLVGLLKRYVPFTGPPNPGTSVVRRAADAITNLAHENVSIKSRVRTEGGIPPLVALLDSYDPKVRLGKVWLCVKYGGNWSHVHSRRCCAIGSTGCSWRSTNTGF